MKTECKGKGASQNGAHLVPPHFSMTVVIWTEKKPLEIPLVNTMSYAGSQGRSNPSSKILELERVESSQNEDNSIWELLPVKELVHTPLSTNSLISFNSTLLGNKPDIYGSKMVTLKETIIRGKSYTHPFTFNQQSLKNIWVKWIQGSKLGPMVEKV